MKFAILAVVFLLLMWFVVNTSWGQTRKVTLTAEVIVDNRSEIDIKGYTHRISVPLGDHMQQRLLAIRYEYPEKLKRRRHKLDNGEYVEIEWDIPAGEKSSRKVEFDLELNKYDFHRDAAVSQSLPPEEYLKPRKFIESDAEPIRKLAAHIRQAFDSDEDRLRAAYLTPQQLLDYDVQSTKGALYAVTEGTGDCTEYAALFVALARAMGYPARTTSEFLLTSRKDFSQPNHHAAEVYIGDRWVPVDPNLALDPGFGYGFGIGGRDKIVLNRDFTWVWSNLWPRELRGNRDKVEVDIRWSVR
ncbi:transglutaminase-like domain-containing protein [Microbulbifer yueqingensis]|uniref:Transglutaminase-like enzyme, putative cysteine protease n=1 Tax=Microbulbifer yueqingensis TaxID=658219 RepID=A0A1G9E666_9GAMM|nr:transglutaminase domain-containing protein [Microbulbifer yueqingensis]SDK71557.1 Transglutaminase-like enzyme, putative cysteine protease [Microbulbifer yueqingensis]